MGKLLPFKGPWYVDAAREGTDQSIVQMVQDAECDHPYEFITLKTDDYVARCTVCNKEVDPVAIFSWLISTDDSVTIMSEMVRLREIRKRRADEQS